MKAAFAFIITALISMWGLSFVAHLIIDYFNTADGLGFPGEYWWNIPLVLTVVGLSIASSILAAQLVGEDKANG